MAISAFCISTGKVAAVPLLLGDLAASVNEFTGSSTAPRYLAEYTTAGVQRQMFPAVPQPGGSGPTTDTLRDLTVGPGNALYLYNGTFTPTLTRLDLVSNTYSQQSFAGFSTINNGTFGGLSNRGPYVFATDQQTFGGTGGEPQGILRFDTTGGPTVRFATNIGPSDLNIGLDGLLYALDGNGSPNPFFYKFDPISLTPLGVIPIQFEDNRAIAVALDGTVYVATSSGVIRRYSAGGTLLNSLTVPGAFFGDIDINPDGRIALGTAQSGEIVLTNLSLTSFTRFRATASTSGGSVFVSWVLPVPEPGTALFGCSLLGVIASRRRRALFTRAGEISDVRISAGSDRRACKSAWSKYRRGQAVLE